MSESLLTKADVAEKLRCSPRKVDDLVQRRLIGFCRIGRLIRFRPGDVEAYERSDHHQLTWKQRELKEELRLAPLRAAMDALSWDSSVPYNFENQTRYYTDIATQRSDHRLSIRTPKWADRGAISAIYAQARAISEETGVPHHVDHVIPIRGELVSGLHVPENLQVIPAVDNIRKSNTFETAAD